MIALWTSITGAAATLLGALLTFWIQRSLGERAATRQRLERERRERLDAYSRFSGAAIHYRLSELTRWHLVSELPGSPEARTAIGTAHRCRAALFEELSRMQILTDDAELREIATDVVERIDAIHRAIDAEERRRRGIEAGERIERFVRHAASDLRPGDHGVIALPFRR